MRPARTHRVGLPRPEPDLFLRIAQEEPEPALEDVEGVLDRGVVVPRDLLLGADLELRDPEARPLGVPVSPLHLVEPAGVLDALGGASTRPDLPPIMDQIAPPRSSASPIRSGVQ